MKHRSRLLVPLVLALSGASVAQDTHKCLGDGTDVTWQSAPCTPAPSDAGVLRLPGYADPAERDGASAPPADASLAAPAEAPFPAAPAPAVLETQPVFPFRTPVALGIQT